jgi:tRNA A-37 threonylcarbamoyl transferase component Bud32/TolB-like protein/Tfp pilus assembly protein PilF
MAESSNTLSPGARLGQYEIVEHLGRGGMADVYKAVHQGLSVHRAIKVIRPELVASEDFQARFQNEAHTVAELRHPNIVQVQDFGEQNGVFYMVMEYVEGRDLKQLRAGEGKMRPVERALEIVIQIAAALEYAHARNLVHRDIKPDNIMLNTDGVPILMDFGIAKLLNAESGITQKGFGIGTPAYIAPEQATALAEVGPAADIYSLSVVLYEMLTGTVPFAAETPMAVMLKAINEPLPLPRSLSPDISDGLQQVILKGTAKEPNDRFHSAHELRDALQAVLDELKDDATFERPMPMQQTHGDVQTHRRALGRVATRTVGAAVIICSGLLFGLLRGAPQDEVAQVTKTAALDIAALIEPEPGIVRLGIHPFVFTDDAQVAEPAHLGRAMAEEVRRSLGSSRGLQVVHRGDPAAVRQHPAPVDVALTGSVRLRNGAGELAAALHTASGEVLWSHVYDFSAEVTFDLQWAIALAVAQTLNAYPGAEIGSLDPVARKPLAVAYNKLLHSSLLMQRRGAENMDQSIELLREALDADPEFARAHLAMAYAYVTFPTYANRREREAFELAEAALRRAEGLDQTLAGEAAGIRGYIALRRWQWDEARELFEIALQMRPDSAEIHGFYAQLLACTGDADGALRHAAIAWDLNAVSPIANAQLAVSLMWQGEVAAAQRQFRIGDELGLHDLGSPGRLLLLYKQNREAETVAALTVMHETFGISADWVGDVIKGVFDPGFREQSGRAFAKAIASGVVAPRVQWPIWVLLGNHDQAFATFERFAERGEYVYLDVEFLSAPDADGFRGDPRYRGLANRYGLPETNCKPGTAQCDVRTVARAALVERNEILTGEVASLRELGEDEQLDVDVRIKHLSSALEKLGLIDERFLPRPLALNFERELIQSRIRQLREASAARVRDLLKNGLRAAAVQEAGRIRAVLRGLDTEDTIAKANALQQLDVQITELNSRAARADAERIFASGRAGGYVEAETAAHALASSSGTAAGAAVERMIADLNQHAQQLRLAEIHTAFAELPESITDREVLVSIAEQLSQLTLKYGELAQTAGWHGQLEAKLADVDEMARMAATSQCGGLANVETFTTIAFVDTDFRFEDKRSRTLAVDRAYSQVSITNHAGLPILVKSITQELIGGDDSFLGSGVSNPATRVLAGATLDAGQQLTMDNNNPAVQTCIGPLTRQSHECRVYMVTTVDLQGHHACQQATLSYREPIHFVSRHTHDNFTIKLWRDGDSSVPGG